MRSSNNLFARALYCYGVLVNRTPRVVVYIVSTTVRNNRTGKTKSNGKKVRKKNNAKNKMSMYRWAATTIEPATAVGNKFCGHGVTDITRTRTSASRTPRRSRCRRPSRGTATRNRSRRPRRPRRSLSTDRLQKITYTYGFAYWPVCEVCSKSSRTIVSNNSRTTLSSMLLL